MSDAGNKYKLRYYHHLWEHREGMTNLGTLGAWTKKL